MQDNHAMKQYLSWICRDQSDLPMFVMVKPASGRPKTQQLKTNSVPTIGDDYAAVWATVHRFKPDAKTREQPEVERYLYLAIDIDNKHSHELKVAATDDERRLTAKKADEVTAFLTAYGLPLPLHVNSGNGDLLLFPIDLPYVAQGMPDSTYDLLSRLGKVLEAAFNDDHCEIDQSVIKDPSRVLGVVGTYNKDKTEVPEDNRVNALRSVVGDYPPNEPMSETEFRNAVEKILATHEVKSPERTKVPNSQITATVDQNEAVRRCRAYLEKCDDAISGKGGHNATFRAACECFGFGLNDQDAWYMITWFNSAKCRPKWSDSELKHKLEDAKKSVTKAGGFGKRLLATSYPTTDLGNTEHFVSLYGHELKWVEKWKKWLLWNGCIWQLDGKQHAHKLVMQFVRHDMPRQAESIGDPDRRAAYLKWASTCQSETRIRAILHLAMVKLTVDTSELDSKGYLFNCANGTLDLSTMSFRHHDRTDLLTKISPVLYEPTATCPKWRNFIGRIFQGMDGKPREDVITYVQQCAGYSITSDVSNQCMFMLHGNGCNGKSTFVNTLMHVIGQYAIQGMQSLLLKLGDRSSRNTDDEAELFGSRMVSISETNEFVPFDEAKVKRLVDTGTIKAMRKFEHPFEFPATHKIWMHCNHKPTVRGTDTGIWRRIKLIPFLQQIPKEEIDMHLAEKLRAEGSGILNWLIDGLNCLKATGGRLKEPTEVSDAVDEYQASSDILGAFLDDCAELKPGEKTNKAALYNRYVEWAKVNGMTYTHNAMAFYKKLQEKGFQEVKVHGNRCFKDLSIKF